jgi:hypothetical protein
MVAMERGVREAVTTVAEEAWVAVAAVAGVATSQKAEARTAEAMAQASVGAATATLVQRQRSREEDRPQAKDPTQPSLTLAAYYPIPSCKSSFPVAPCLQTPVFAATRSRSVLSRA